MEVIFAKYAKKPAMPFHCSTSTAEDEEGFGAQVLCSGCAKTGAVAQPKQMTISKEGESTEVKR